MTNTCNHCGGRHCSKHLLPENHDCIGLSATSREWSSDGYGVFSNATGVLGIEDDADEADDESGSTQESSSGEKSVTSSTEAKTENEAGGKTALDSDESVDNQRGPSGRHRDIQAPSGPDVNPDGSVATNQQSGDEDDTNDPSPWLGVFTPNSYEGDCPNCGRYVRRLWSDQILTCKRCGWTAGVPYLRQLTHRPNWDRGVPTRRTVFSLVLLSFAAVALIGATVGTGVAPIDRTATDGAGYFAGVLNSTSQTLQSTATPTEAVKPNAVVGSVDESSTATPTESTLDEINRTRIEFRIHLEINERREALGLRSLVFDRDLREIARYHSRDMAEEGYFAHDSLNGETMGERYELFDYDCRVSTGENTYATGTENIAYTYWEEEIEGGLYHNSNRDVAEGIVNQWMNSASHRANILRDYWQNEGIGVYVITDSEDRIRVYATQNFC